tara:strand:- start:747 stop:1148 length:402 start_codon:yes stop_codon:yes gene_type:complete
MRKGDLVKLNLSDPEIKRITGWGMRNEAYMASRPTTGEEQEEWRVQKRNDIKRAQERGEDTFHIAFNDAGESRLAPRSVSVELPVNGVYIVEKARCRVKLGWGNPAGGMTKILNTQTGECAYVSREMLQVVND